MSRRVFVLGICSLALPLLLFAEPPGRQKQWKSVQEAMNKGLPRTAIERLEPIIATANEAAVITPTATHDTPPRNGKSALYCAAAPGVSPCASTR